jgi:hypothetical protein
MIFSLPPALIKTAEKVLHNNKQVAYSWGNTDALNKWIISMDKKQIDAILGLNGKIKYPLIWLVEGWQSSEVIGGYKFKATFWISCNSDVSTLNENRNFSIQYKVANDFIEKLKLTARIGDDSIKWTEQSNVSTNKESKQSDIWDSVIMTLDIIINKNCISKLYK